MVSYRAEESGLSSIPPGPASTINLWKGSSLYVLPNNHVNHVKPWKISREAFKREFKNRLQQAYLTLILVGRSLPHCESRRADASTPTLLALRTCLSVSPLTAPPRPRTQKHGRQPIRVPRSSRTGPLDPSWFRWETNALLIQYELSF